jgi:hypothetical protein
MRGWNVTALGAAGAAIAALIPVACGFRRRRRKKTIAGREQPERRIEFVAIDDAERNPKQGPHL